MITRITPSKGLTSVVTTGGSSSLIATIVALGGVLQNPLSNEDQGLTTEEPLYYSIAGPAGISVSNTTFMLPPGGIAVLPPNVLNGIWVNANTSGHKFSFIQFTPYTQPYQAFVTNFPPIGPTGLLETIASYLYQQYSDDEDLQAFVRTYNVKQQSYVDAFNSIDLPDYTQSASNGSLLDWTAQGIYGLSRPSILSGRYTSVGGFDTYVFNSIYINEALNVELGNISMANDDLYKRILTWHLFKGDGKYFGTRWLKRRVARFIWGDNGTNPVDKTSTTYQISVTFGTDREATIRFVLYDRKVIRGTNFNDTGFTYNGRAYNQDDTQLVNLPPLPYMKEFQQSLMSGALELPFQYTFKVKIG
jgi:hypothetical protein